MASALPARLSSIMRFSRPSTAMARSLPPPLTSPLSASFAHADMSTGALLTSMGVSVPGSVLHISSVSRRRKARWVCGGSPDVM